MSNLEVTLQLVGGGLQLVGLVVAAAALGREWGRAKKEDDTIGRRFVKPALERLWYRARRAVARARGRTIPSTVRVYRISASGQPAIDPTLTDEQKLRELERRVGEVTTQLDSFRAESDEQPRRQLIEALPTAAQGIALSAVGTLLQLLAVFAGIGR